MKPDPRQMAAEMLKKIEGAGDVQAVHIILAFDPKDADKDEPDKELSEQVDNPEPKPDDEPEEEEVVEEEEEEEKEEE